MGAIHTICIDNNLGLTINHLVIINHFNRARFIILAFEHGYTFTSKIRRRDTEGK